MGKVSSMISAINAGNVDGLREAIARPFSHSPIRGGTTRIDPVVTGTVQSVITGDSAAALGLDPNRTYVVVDASLIDVLDGSGFQSAAGETFFIDVTDQGPEFASQMRDMAGQNIMFMGDVSIESESGRFVITMNVSYGDGVVTDANEIANIVNDPSAMQSQGWYQQNLAINQAIFSNFADFLGDWRTGFGILTATVRGMNQEEAWQFAQRF